MKQWAVLCCMLWVSVALHAQGELSPPVLNAPVSYTQVYEAHTTLPNGKRKNTSAVADIERDSGGRTRSKYREHGQLPVTTVIDRVGRTEYWWNDVSHICMLKRLPPPAKPVAAVAALEPGQTRVVYVGTGAERHKTEETALPAENFEGLLVPGVRTLRFAADGIAVVSTTDRFYDAELKAVMYEEVTTPAGDREVWRSKNFKRAEPKAALFAAPPKGYTVREADEPDADKFE